MSRTNCCNCGAVLPPHSEQCVYCGTTNSLDLAAVHRYTTISPQSTRRCPSCRTAMATLDIGDGKAFLVERCGRCNGIFFDLNELESMLEDLVKNVHQVDPARLEHVRESRPAAPPVPASYRPCPECGSLMNRVNAGAGSGVVIDRCGRHGAWVDGDKLQRILAWRKAGGHFVDAKVRSERQREAQTREKNQLKAENDDFQRANSPLLLARLRRSSDSGSDTPGLLEFLARFFVGN